MLCTAVGTASDGGSRKAALGSGIVATRVDSLSQLASKLENGSAGGAATPRPVPGAEMPGNGTAGVGSDPNPGSSPSPGSGTAPASAADGIPGRGTGAVIGDSSRPGSGTAAGAPLPGRTISVASDSGGGEARRGAVSPGSGTAPLGALGMPDPGSGIAPAPKAVVALGSLGRGTADGALGSPEPGSGTAPAPKAVVALLPGSGTEVTAVGSGGFSAAAIPSLIGKVVWQRVHLSFAPPGGIRLSSML